MPVVNDSTPARPSTSSTRAAAATIEISTVRTTKPGFGRTWLRSAAAEADSGRAGVGGGLAVDEGADVAELGDGAARGIRRFDSGCLELGDAEEEVVADLLLQVLGLRGELDARERLVEEPVDVGAASDGIGGVHARVPFVCAGTVVPSRSSMMPRVATQVATLERNAARPASVMR